MKSKRKPNRKTVRDAIRASVPQGKLKKARIFLSDAPVGAQPIAGYTKYERENGGPVVSIGAPASDDAFGITVRGHETRHATRHRLQRKKPVTANMAIASQIIDDVNNELGTSVPRTKFARPYRRAHLTMAMRGVLEMRRVLRRVKSGALKDGVAVHNANLLNAVRSRAMLESYGLGGDSELETYNHGYEKIRISIGNETMDAVNQIVGIARYRRNRNRAISMLVALMETEESPEESDEELPQFPDGDILAPPVGGDALDGHMKITDLRPKSVFTAKERTITRRYSPDGVHLNPARYVNAIVSGDAHGLFHRRVRQKPSGTVLIDASGSMHANRYNLSQICELVPTATVAYYSGSDGRGRGELVIYAYQGKRFAGELPENTLHGGNAVDLPAVRWMMNLPKPWTLISDLDFCGGVLGSEMVALAIVDRAVKRGDLTVHRSLDAAFEAFGGKGELQNESPAERAEREGFRLARATARERERIAKEKRAEMVKAKAKAIRGKVGPEEKA